MEKKQIENDVKNIYKNLAEQNSFFSNVQSFDSIIANAHFHNIMFMAKYKLFGCFLLFFFGEDLKFPNIFIYLKKSNKIIKFILMKLCSSLL